MGAGFYHKGCHDLLLQFLSAYTANVRVQCTGLGQEQWRRGINSYSARRTPYDRLSKASDMVKFGLEMVLLTYREKVGTPCPDLMMQSGTSQSFSNMSDTFVLSQTGYNLSHWPISLQHQSSLCLLQSRQIELA